jgi:hypothetical protein
VRAATVELAGLEPGVVHINDWHLEIAPSPPPPAGDVAAPIYGGVGRKP